MYFYFSRRECLRFSIIYYFRMIDLFIYFIVTFEVRIKKLDKILI